MLKLNKEDSMKKLFFIAAFLIGLSTLGYSDIRDIVPTGPDGSLQSAAYGGVYVSTNGGTSWTQYDTGATQAVDVRGTNAFAVGQHNGDIVYVSSGSGAGGFLIRRSTNGGVDWANYTGAATGNDAAPDIHCPYAGNDDDSTIFFWGNKQYRQLIRYTTAGGAENVFGQTEADVEASAGGQGRILISGSSIYILKTLSAGTFDLLRSDDAGATWNTRSAALAASTRAMGAWPYDFNQVFLIPPSQPALSIDGGYNFLNKTGDWVATMGTVFDDGNEKPVIVPIWSV